MDRPCFSHSKTHIGKSNQRSVAKVMGNFSWSLFFEIPCGSPEFESLSHNRLPVSCSFCWKTVSRVLASHSLQLVAPGVNIDIKIIKCDHNIYGISIWFKTKSILVSNFDVQGLFLLNFYENQFMPGVWKKSGVTTDCIIISDQRR